MAEVLVKGGICIQSQSAFAIKDFYGKSSRLSTSFRQQKDMKE